jgi:hypothetical protein
MKRVAPPFWVESVLLFLLPKRDRETVSGDLYEEFLEQKFPELGRFRANLWYMRQVPSFAPRRLSSAFEQGQILRLLCLFTAMAGGWLGMMDLRLRHPGYAGQEVIAGTIVCQALLTLGALRCRRYMFLRLISMLGSLALFCLAGKALTATLRGTHFEGYVLLIAFALIAQALLTLFTLPRVQDPPRHSA